MLRVVTTALLVGLQLAVGSAFVVSLGPAAPTQAQHRPGCALTSRRSSTALAATRSQALARLTKEEEELLDSISGLSRRDEQNPAAAGARVRRAIAALEVVKGIKQPVKSPVIEGKWKLLFTSQDNTASPIQRGVVGNDRFTVYQLIDLSSREPSVTNMVDFGLLGELRVNALASTAARPIPGFVPRRGDGRILGLNIFGVSQSKPPEDPFQRIDFQFIDAGFDLSFLPFKLPYPVPFRLLGDEVKGFIDVTYMGASGVRVSRGNKGTIFVLQKVE